MFSRIATALGVVLVSGSLAFGAQGTQSTNSNQAKPAARATTNQQSTPASARSPPLKRIRSITRKAPRQKTQRGPDQIGRFSSQWQKSTSSPSKNVPAKQ